MAFLLPLLASAAPTIVEGISSLFGPTEEDYYDEDAGYYYDDYDYYDEEDDWSWW